MNERIRELAEQAHSYACKYAQQPDYNPHNPYNQGMYKQRYDSKFAELIVNQCADIAQQHNKSPVAAPLAIGYVIREHFGVEE
jgi:hypothetical protein